MLEMQCPYCQKRIELDDDRRGRPSRCPKCGGAFRAPLYDGEAATGVASGSVATADMVALVGAMVGGMGLAAILVVLGTFLAGAKLLVPKTVVVYTLPLVLIPIVISVLVGRKATRRGWVWASKILGYLWAMGQVFLLVKLMKMAGGGA